MSGNEAEQVAIPENGPRPNAPVNVGPNGVWLPQLNCNPDPSAEPRPAMDLLDQEARVQLDSDPVTMEAYDDENCSMVSESLPGSETEETTRMLESNIDGLNNKKRRVKKMKMIRDPCNCSRQKRGRNCKHVKEIGATVEKTIVCNGDTLDSSDSEMLIRSSNCRNRNSYVPECGGNPANQSPSIENSLVELDRLISVGKAIGVEMENKEEMVVKLLGKGDGLVPW